MTDLLEQLRDALADRYAVDREIGRGGMATVYLAEDLKHHRKVAIKVLNPELAAAVGSDRFLREIETVAGLTHPHVLPLHDSGETDGLLYYTMPYLAGESLRTRLSREGQLPLEDALRITGEVASALGHAHEAGIVHRDIKPANILFESGHAVVADFGIARAVQAGDKRLTQTGLSAGTPIYMSPEQAAGQQVDERSDIYALGCVLWEMLAGEPPFDGPNPQAILARKATEEPPPVRGIRNTVPPALENVLAKAMATSRADRFQTAGEFADALRSPETVGRMRRRGRDKRRLATIGAIAVVAVAAGTWAAVTRRSPGSESADPTVIALDSTAIAVLPFQVIGADSASPTRELAASIGTLFDLKVTGEFGRRIAYPASVSGQWRRAGGSPDSALSEAEELQLGRDLGVGALVRGTLVEADDEIVIAASMVDVETGAIRVTTVRAEGRLEERLELVDELIVLLLSRDAGYSAASAPKLARYEPDAIQAYIAGIKAPSFSAEEDRYFRAALAADSNLVDAALLIYATGESPANYVELRYAWDHQDRLSERGRARLQVLAAGRFDGRAWTPAEVIAGYEALTRTWPEWGTPWIELGSKLAVRGALVGAPDWRRRAREALEHIDRPGDFTLWNLTELAFMDEDTARARKLADRFQTVVAGSRGMLAERGLTYQWRAAILEGDTAAATRALALSPDSVWVPGFALADGRGIADADRVVAAGAADYWFPDNWAWARGREPEWRERSERRPENQFIVPVVRALLLGPSEDTAAVESIQALERIANATDSEEYSPDDRTQARCWVTLWQLEHADTTGARRTLRYLTDSDRSHLYADWAGVIELLLARLEGDEVRASLLRADSAVKALGRSAYSTEFHNLILARLFAEYEEPDRALAAIRRRVYHAPWAMDYSVGAVPEYLREEARLAAVVGDTAGAIEAYRHYFALRDSRPDHPTWGASWDSMRVEYGALTGVDVP